MYDILSNRREWKAADDTGPAPLQLDALGRKNGKQCKKGKGGATGESRTDGKQIG